LTTTPFSGIIIEFLASDDYRFLHFYPAENILLAPSIENRANGYTEINPASDRLSSVLS
jgi:hypothetical protein